MNQSQRLRQAASVFLRNVAGSRRSATSHQVVAELEAANILSPDDAPIWRQMVESILREMVIKDDLVEPLLVELLNAALEHRIDLAADDGFAQARRAKSRTRLANAVQQFHQATARL